MKSVPPLLAAAALSAFPFAAHADVIFHDGFETPAVTGRVPRAAGGDPSKPTPSTPAAIPAWSRFEDHPNLGETEGSIVAGLSTQSARTGRQALFVEAARLSAPFLGVLFVTRPIAIEGGTGYQACLWGCNDPQKPLSCAAAQLLLKIQVDFFSDEGKTEVGESQYFLHPLPGTKGKAPLLHSGEWHPVSIRFAAPAGARTMVLSFRCNSCAEKGAVSGAVYWDDFTVETVPPGAAIPPAGCAVQGTVFPSPTP